jgi:hypothetical protein
MASPQSDAAATEGTQDISHSPALGCSASLELAPGCSRVVPILFFRQPSTPIFELPVQAGYGDKWPS